MLIVVVALLFSMQMRLTVLTDGVLVLKSTISYLCRYNNNFYYHRCIPLYV